MCREQKILLQQELQGNSGVLDSIPSPCYVLSLNALEFNLKLLNDVALRSRAKILVALKGYSFWREFQTVRNYLFGATCSGVYEARLAFEEIAKPVLCAKIESISLLSQNPKEFALAIQRAINAKQEKVNTEKSVCQDTVGDLQGNLIPYAFFYPFVKKEVCVFSPAYKETQVKEILHYATNIIFNSFAQWEKFKHLIVEKNEEIRKLYIKYGIDTEEIPKIQVGLRINPLYSEVEPPIYNPCIPKSRLGIIPSEFNRCLSALSYKYNYATPEDFFLAHFDGLHFHTHCEQGADALQRTLKHVIQHFDKFIGLARWVNFGGGHHITRDDYDVDLLINIIQDFKRRYKDIEVVLEPGEAVGWQTGDLIGEVVDIIENEGYVALLDVSASCHMPDCLEMPYRPKCYKIDSHSLAFEEDLGEGVAKYSYRFGGPTCLAGDVIGDYSFSTPLRIGDKVVFCDMLHYTIVKNTTFNGIELPSLGVLKDNAFHLVKQFDYTHFKDRN